MNIESSEVELIEQRLVSLEEQLKILINLMALSVAPAKDAMIDRAVLLQKAGLPPKHIAALCDSTPNAVSVALTKAKRQSRKGKK
jgi:hypothetical protein